MGIDGMDSHDQPAGLGWRNCLILFATLLLTGSGESADDPAGEDLVELPVARDRLRTSSRWIVLDVVATSMTK